MDQPVQRVQLHQQLLAPWGGRLFRGGRGGAQCGGQGGDGVIGHGQLHFARTQQPRLALGVGLLGVQRQIQVGGGAAVGIVQKRAERLVAQARQAGGQQLLGRMVGVLDAQLRIQQQHRGGQVGQRGHGPGQALAGRGSRGGGSGIVHAFSGVGEGKGPLPRILYRL